MRFTVKGFSILFILVWFAVIAMISIKINNATNESEKALIEWQDESNALKNK